MAIRTTNIALWELEAKYIDDGVAEMEERLVSFHFNSSLYKFDFSALRRLHGYVLSPIGGSRR